MDWFETFFREFWEDGEQLGAEGSEADKVDAAPVAVVPRVQASAAGPNSSKCKASLAAAPSRTSLPACNQVHGCS